MALGPGSFSDHLRIERLPIAMLPLPERILAAFQAAADGLADARPQDSVPLGALKDESYWDLRRLDSFVPDKSRHRLGNLVLLPPKLNSAVQDKPAKGKAAHYRKTGLLIAGEVADVIDPASWNSRSIRERGGAAARVSCRGVGGLIGGAGTSRRRGLQPGRVAVGSSQDCRCAGSARQRRPDVRRHATLPQAWMQRENWEFETHTLRPFALAGMIGLLTFVASPSRMAWSTLPLPLWLRWMGVGVGVVAACLLIWTFRSLGTNLTDTVVTRKDHTLVTSGPYRVVRHPFYVASTLAIAANALATANWFIGLTGGLVVVLLVIRTATEEAQLMKRFGDAYVTYMKRTGRFLPRILQRES